ncbi:MAG: ABC-2 transporter permease [Collinsella sp.]|nr:ABC-2 transporter permease [Collinsella sp.]
MKRAFMSELAIARTLIPSIAGVGLFIFVVLTLANASDGDSGMSAGACAVSAMSPIMIMNSLAGYDNQNGWERYRATLPFSRKDIICARYLCIIAFSAVMACAAVLLNIIALPFFDPTGILALPFFDHTGIPSTGQTVFEITIASAASMLISLMMVFLAQPLFFRFGHMEALRFSVGLFALMGCGTMAMLSSSNPISNWLMSIAGANPDPAVLGGLCAGIAVLALVLCAISCTVSTKVYRVRDL